MANEVKSVSDVVGALERRGQDASELSAIGVRPRLGEYLRELWSRRHFIWFDSRKRAESQNARNILGNLWLVLRPMLDALFYFLIFGVLLDLDRGVDNYPAFILIGILLYRSTLTALTSGANAMRNSKPMLRAFTFPRVAVPIANVLQASITAVYTMMTMCVAIIIVPEHELPKLTWLLLIPIFFLQVLQNLGITLIAARVGYHFPDVTNMMHVFGRFLMYGSGVLFPISRFIEDPTIQWIVMLNPLYRIIDMARVTLIDGRVPALESWIIVMAWVVVMVVGGFLFFWRGEESYGRELR